MNGWWPLAVAGILYLGQAWYYSRAGDWGMTLSFVAYAFANLGFIVDFIHKTQS